MSKATPGRAPKARGRDAKRRGDPAVAGSRFEDSPFYLVARINGRYTIDMEAKLKAIAMDIPRWRTLMIVAQREPVSISEIADLAVMRLPTAMRVLQRLQRAGLVRMAPRTSDGRRTDVTLTPQGAEAVRRVSAVASHIYHRAFDDFSATEVELLNELLRRVFNNLVRAA